MGTHVGGILVDRKNKRLSLQYSSYLKGDVRARTGTGKNQNFLCSADHKQDLQPCPVDTVTTNLLEVVTDSSEGLGAFFFFL